MSRRWSGFAPRKELTALGFNVQLPFTVAREEHDDVSAHVNNCFYFTYFEQSRAEYCRATGIPYRMPPKPKGEVDIKWIIANLSCSYRKPLAFPDNLILGCKATTVSNRKLILEHVIFSVEQSAVAAVGTEVALAIDYATNMRSDIPREWLEGIQRVDKVVASGPTSAL